MYICTVSFHHASHLNSEPGWNFCFRNMQYNKQPIKVTDQLLQLKDRGLEIEDETSAEKVLSIISYFRFANYLRPMEADKETHTFKQGKKFGNAVDLYYFDKELRSVIFSAIQTVEIALRTSIIQNFSMAQGAFCFMDYSLFKNDIRKYIDCLTKIQTEISRSKEDFIKDHYDKYDSPYMPPSWKTLEVVSFGTLCKLYGNFKDNTVKKSVARSFNIPNHEYLESWMVALAALRNYCAHHARVWNRIFPLKPQLPIASKMRADWVDVSAVDPSRLYALLCCLLYWVNNIQPDNTLKADILQLMKKHPNVDPSAMGFPVGWGKEALWK